MRLPLPRASRGAQEHAIDQEALTRVHRLLAEGRSSGQIAHELVIRPKTVSTHAQRILGKLGVHNRTQAVAAAYASGLPIGELAGR